MILRCLLLALALAFGAALPARAEVKPAAQGAPRAEPREILVMLRMPAPHYRPNAQYGGRYDDRAAQAARRRVAVEIARENGLELLEGWPMPLIGVDCYRMRVPTGVSLEGVIGKVSDHRMVAWAQPVQDYQALAAPDPLFAAQPTAAQWRLADLHRVATGKGVTIAVIDSKIETTHPDLAGQFAASRDFVTGAAQQPEEHGTGVAGVIAAKPGNGIGIVGVAPGSRLLALRACTERRQAGRPPVSSCDTLSLAKALQYALESGADVINMSLSGPQDRLLGMLIGSGLQRHAVVVAAFDPQLPGGGFPASAPGVIAVAQDTLPSVPQQVYRAPGTDIPTTEPGGKWNLVNGSSFAAAQISGLVALLREEHGNHALPPRFVRQPGGAVDACATLVAVSRTCDCACAIARAPHR